MKKYIAPMYEREVIETADIILASVTVSQDGENTNPDMSADSLFNKIESVIRFGE